MRHRLTWDKTAARTPGGLYGFTKKVQADCESCVRKLNRHATSLVKTAYAKDERIVAFLQTHAKRAKSASARVLLAALKESAPKIAGKGGKVAASKTYGLYGYPSNTVKLGLAMCSQLREQAGLLGADLHARRVAKHARITSFLKQHSKKARCYSSRMLLAGYPDADAKYASGAPGKKASDHMVTAGVDSWLAWDMSEMDDDTSHYG